MTISIDKELCRKEPNIHCKIYLFEVVELSGIGQFAKIIVRGSFKQGHSNKKWITSSGAILHKGKRPLYNIDSSSNVSFIAMLL